MRRARKRGEKTRGDRTWRCKSRWDQNKKSIFCELLRICFYFSQVRSYLFCFWKMLFHLSSNLFCSVFFFLLSFFFLCLPLVFSKNRKKRDTAWCDGCPTDETNDNLTYMDFTRSTTSPHAAAIKRAFNRASTLRPMRKSGFPWNKKVWFVFPKSTGIDGVSRNRDEGDENPFALRWPQRRGFLAERRHVAPTTSTPQHWRASKCPPQWNWALDFRHARTMGSHVVKGATAECMTALDMPASTAWCGNTTAVTASVPKKSSHSSCLFGSSGAFGRQGRTPGLVRCSQERPGMMAHGDKTSWQRTTILLRVGPSSFKLKSFHLPSATAVGGRPRSGATPLCMMALDVPNFQMWSKGQYACSVMGSRERKWGLSLLGQDHCKDENSENRCHWRWHQSSQRTDVWEIAPPSASGADTTLSGWGTFHEWMQRRVTRFWQTLQFLSRTAPHARSDHHTRGEGAYWCKVRLSTSQCRESTQFFHFLKLNLKSPMWKFWISDFLQNAFSFFSYFENVFFHRNCFVQKKSLALCKSPIVVISSCLEEISSPPTSSRISFFFLKKICFLVCFY